MVYYKIYGIHGKFKCHDTMTTYKEPFGWRTAKQLRPINQRPADEPNPAFYNVDHSWTLLFTGDNNSPANGSNAFLLPYDLLLIYCYALMTRRHLDMGKFKCLFSKRALPSTFWIKHLVNSHIRLEDSKGLFVLVFRIRWPLDRHFCYSVKSGLV